MKKQKKYPGVYETALSDGTCSYRASVTFRQKHISLGSYQSASAAHHAYLYACHILQSSTWKISGWKKNSVLSFEKCIVLANFKDNGIYIPTPIYMGKRFFSYYLSVHTVLKFDIDDLFYYSSHKIMKRGSHLFVADYGSQVNILNRYGIKSHAVIGRDYRFANGDPTDLRYENIIILNRYHGVRQFAESGFVRYKSIIHIKGNYIIGTYQTETEAAIAYNKAADILQKKGVSVNYIQNYVEGISPSEYAEIYTRISISPKISTYTFPKNLTAQSENQADI